MFFFLGNVIYKTTQVLWYHPGKRPLYPTLDSQLDCEIAQLFFCLFLEASLLFVSQGMHLQAPFFFLIFLFSVSFVVSKGLWVRKLSYFPSFAFENENHGVIFLILAV